MIYLIGINLLSLLVIGIDKYKAIKKHWRIPENSIILLSFLGGGIGSLLGMHLFHHKTKKLKFQILIPLSILLTIYILIKKGLTLPLTVVLFYK